MGAPPSSIGAFHLIVIDRSFQSRTSGAEGGRETAENTNRADQMEPKMNN
jgi:hypothetical protein